MHRYKEDETGDRTPLHVSSTNRRSPPPPHHNYNKSRDKYERGYAGKLVRRGRNENEELDKGSSRHYGYDRHGEKGYMHRSPSPTNSNSHSQAVYPPMGEGLFKYHVLWHLRQSYTVPSWSWTRRRFRENADGKILNPLKRVMSHIGLLLLVLYRVFICRLCCLEIFPYWGLEIIIGVEIFLFALRIFLSVDAAWHDWKRKRRLKAAAAAQYQV